MRFAVHGPRIENLVGSAGHAAGRDSAIAATRPRILIETFDLAGPARLSSRTDWLHLLFRLVTMDRLESVLIYRGAPDTGFHEPRSVGETQRQVIECLGSSQNKEDIVGDDSRANSGWPPSTRALFNPAYH